jgi:hypothetical protein
LLIEPLGFPREVKQDSEFNALRNCLGKRRLIVFQGVSEWLPKLQGRRLKISAGFPVTVDWQVQVRDAWFPGYMRDPIKTPAPAQ